MEVKGKILSVLDKRTGQSKKNPDEMWESQDFVIETQGQYPKKMMFTVFGADRLQRMNIQQGEELTVLFDIDAREWNGRWFNDIRAYDVRRGEDTQNTAYNNQQAQSQPQSQPQPSAEQSASAPRDVQQESNPFAQPSNDKDLPF